MSNHARLLQCFERSGTKWRCLAFMVKTKRNIMAQNLNPAVKHSRGEGKIQLCNHMTWTCYCHWMKQESNDHTHFSLFINTQTKHIDRGLPVIGHFTIMPTTGLQLVEQGYVHHGGASSFQNSWKMSGHPGYEFLLEFGPILVWYKFPPAEEFGVFFDIFCLMMHQMFSIIERSGLLAGKFSTQTLLWWGLKTRDIQ